MAAGAELAQGQVPLGLGEPSAGGVADEGEVAVGGGRPAERLEEEELPGGGEEQVLAAHHLGDLLGEIVDRAGQFVGGGIVAAPDEEIAEVFPGGEGEGAAAGIGDGISRGGGSRRLGGNRVPPSRSVPGRSSRISRRECGLG
jgi:hypothetical protein